MCQQTKPVRFASWNEFPVKGSVRKGGEEMVKLYTFNKAKEFWQFEDYGLRSKASEYTGQGYIVLFVW